ncbi:unnamed protein product, partial [Aphanomyces euteiches]
MATRMVFVHPVHQVVVTRLLVPPSGPPFVVVFKHNPFYHTVDDHQCQCSPSVFEILDKDACWRRVYHKSKSLQGTS